MMPGFPFRNVPVWAGIFYRGMFALPLSPLAGLLIGPAVAVFLAVIHGVAEGYKLREIGCAMEPTLLCTGLGSAGFAIIRAGIRGEGFAVAVSGLVLLLLFSILRKRSRVRI